MAQKTRKTKQPSESSADKRMAWLLAFLDRDVTTLRVGELLDLGVDVTRYLLDPRATIAPGEDDADAVILYRGIIKDEGRPLPKSLKGVVQGMRERPASIDPNDRTGTEGITDDDVMSLKRPFLQKLQDTLRGGMRNLFDGKAWVPFDGNVVPPKLLIQRRRDGTLGRSYYAGPILPVLLASAIDLLAEFWPQIRRCANPDCAGGQPVFFLPSHGRQIFHSPKCSGIVRQKRLPPRNYAEEERRRAQQEFDKKHRKPGKGKK